jgi:hypothetical protein
VRGVQHALRTGRVRQHGVLRCVSSAALVMLLLSACFGDRDRPGPSAPDGGPLLNARVLEPETGTTVLTGRDIVVRIEAQDLSRLYLNGVGFVARRLSPGMPLVDSAAVRFGLQEDSTHEFTFRVPNTYPTNTQVDIYGIAFGVGGQTRLSEPVHVVVIQCGVGECD